MSSTFYGRDADIAHLTTLLSRHRCVQIVGPVGVGKSRLAAEYLESVRGLFVELTVATTLEDALHEIGAQAGVQRETGSVEVDAQMFARHLHGRGIECVVFDNVEQLAGCVEPLFACWRDAAPTQMLITTRQPLVIPGAQILTLQPVEAAAAVEILRTRRAQVSGDPPHVHPLDLQLVERLDRLPLAIELASGWLQRTPIEALLEELDGQSRSAPTLRAATRRSWLQLTSEQRDVLCAIAVVPQGVSRETLTRLCPDAELGTTLRGLLDAGLVRRVRAPGAPRFAVFAAVRADCEARLSPARRQALAEALIEDLVDALPRTLSWLAFTNVWHCAVLKLDRGALEFSWRAVADERSARTVAVGLCLVSLLMIVGPRSRSLAVADKLSAVAEALGDADLLGWCQFARGYMHWGWGSLAEAREILVGVERGHTGPLGRSAMRWRVECDMAMGVFDADAVAVIEAEPFIDAVDEAERSHMLTGVLVRAGHTARGERWAQRAVELAKSVGSDELTYVVAMNQGYLARLRGGFDVAQRWRETALDAALRGQSERNIRQAQMGCALNLLDVGEPTRAQAMLGSALAQAQAVGNHKQIAQAHEWLGAAALYAGDVETAIGWLRNAGNGATVMETGARVAGLLAVADHLAGEPVDIARFRAAGLGVQDAYGRIFKILGGAGVPDDTPDWLAWAARGAALHARVEARMDWPSARLEWIAVLAQSRPSILLNILVHRLAGQQMARRDAQGPRLQIAPTGSRYRLPDATEVDLSARPMLMGLLAALFEARGAQPGSVVTVDALWAAAWPGEQAQPASIAQRVRANLHNLRRTGLGAVIETANGGYRLSIETPMVALCDHD